MLLLCSAQMNRRRCSCNKDTSPLLMPQDESRAAGGTHPPHCCLFPSLKILILNLGHSKGGSVPSNHRFAPALPPVSCTQAQPQPDCAYGRGHKAWKGRLLRNQEKRLEILDAESVGKKLTTFMFIRRQINHYNNKISL